MSEITLNFRKEFAEAVKGERSSLSNFVTKFPWDISKLDLHAVVADTLPESWQTLIIGGSYIKTEGAKFQLPTLDTLETLLQTIKEQLLPSTKNLLLSFAYPIQTVENQLDGVLLRSTKGHAMQGLVGQQVGKKIAEGIPVLEKVLVVNDVVANLAALGIKAFAENSDNYSAINVIAGTGFNIGLAKGNGEFINLEAGNFNNFTPKPEISYIDATSSNTGHQLFEKQVSGKYLSERYNKLAVVSLAREEFEAELEDSEKDKNALLNSLLIESGRDIGQAVAGVLQELLNTRYILIDGSMFENKFFYEAFAAEVADYNARIVSIPHCNWQGAFALTKICAAVLR